jgi:cardiolipin synthase
VPVESSNPPFGTCPRLDVSAGQGLILRRPAGGFTLGTMRIPGPFLTVPNLLSISRLLGLPLFLWSLSTPGYNWLAAMLVVYAIVSDLADGFLARRLNQTSAWGRILDPLADKVTAAAALLFCYWRRGLPAWILVLILSRDLLILSLSPVFAARRRAIPESLLSGRLAALAIGCLAIAYLFEIRAAQGVTLAASAVLVLISGWQYARRLASHAD